MAETIAVIVALILAGLVLFILEVLTPTFGVLAGLALAALATAIVLGFRLSSTLGLMMIVAAVIGVPAYLVVLIRLLPRISFTRKFFLQRARSAAAEATPEAPRLRELVGKTGTVETPLRPSGAIRIEGRQVPAMAESAMIERGAAVKVVRARGTDVVVRRVEVEG